jgi:hypothetical protein
VPAPFLGCRRDAYLDVSVLLGVVPGQPGRRKERRRIERGLAREVVWCEEGGVELVMATHDRAPGTTARASGLKVIGL